MNVFMQMSCTGLNQKVEVDNSKKKKLGKLFLLFPHRTKWMLHLFIFRLVTVIWPLPVSLLHFCISFPSFYQPRIEGAAPERSRLKAVGCGIDPALQSRWPHWAAGAIRGERRRPCQRAGVGWRRPSCLSPVSRCLRLCG